MGSSQLVDGSALYRNEVHLSETGSGLFERAVGMADGVKTCVNPIILNHCASFSRLEPLGLISVLESLPVLVEDIDRVSATPRAGIADTYHPAFQVGESPDSELVRSR